MYASRKLKKHEKNMDSYSSMKLEQLGLKWAVGDKFKDYLYGSTFTVYTDNASLTQFKSSKLAATKTRWLVLLASYDFTIKLKHGKKNSVAYALSRNPHNTFETLSEATCDIKGEGTKLPTILMQNI